MPEERGRLTQDELRYRLEEAFVDAYPEVPDEEARHMARNLAQVIIGTIDIGDKRGADREVSHMDVANAFVYWCMASTYLEDLGEGRRNPALADPASPVLGDKEMRALVNEFVARAADLLIGLRILSEHPEMYEAFIRGSVALGASTLERDRGKLAY